MSESALKRLFNLFLVFLKTDDHESKQILKVEIDALRKEFEKDNAISDDIKAGFDEILRQYEVIYQSDSLIEKYEAEERVREIIQKIRSLDVV